MTSSSAIVSGQGQFDRQSAFLWGVALPAALFLSQVIYLWGFTIDDVAITYRYALHLANGQGLAWNLGGTRVEGYSNFLWVLILTAAGWIGLNIETAAAVLGTLLGLVCLGLLFHLCRKLWAPARFWWSPVLLVALTPEWAIWAVSGLEIPLFCALLLLGILGLTETNSSRCWLLSVAIPGLVLTRPEGLLMACIVLACGILAEPGSVRQRLQAYAAPIMVTLTTAAGLLVFRLLYFGSPLPNTVYAKFSGSLPSLGQVLDWVVFGIPFLVAWAVAFRGLWTQKFPWVLVAAILMIVVQMVIVLPVLPVMYFLHRYQIAFLPLLVLAVPTLVALVPLTRRWAATVMLVLMLAWTFKEWPQVDIWVQSERYWRQTRQDVAQTLKLLPPDTKLALVDAGYIPYLSDLPTIDVWGLCDRRTAMQGFSAEATMEESPDVYVMSVRVREDGHLTAFQGRDGLIGGTIRFRDRYRVWKLCGHPRQAGQKSFEGYAIFVDSASACARAIGQLTKP